jgi:PKD repeat protein
MPPAKPVVRFTISPRVPAVTDSIQLVDCSHDPGQVGIAWRAWDFGDGATSVGAAPSHRYSSPGEYEITLTLATYDGRVGHESQTVAVRASSPDDRHFTMHSDGRPNAADEWRPGTLADDVPPDR